MSKKNSILISKKKLGLVMFIGLFIQFVFPQIKLGEFIWISTLIYFLVGIYLFFI